MIRKLRFKFVCINMLLVSLVLLVVFATLFLTTYRRLDRESYDAMRHTLERGMNEPPPKLEIKDKRPKEFFPFYPVFCVHINATGEIVEVTGQNVEISDEILQEATLRALESNRQYGVLTGLRLRYLHSEEQYGLKIAFCDLSNDLNTMTDLLSTSLFVGFGGLAAFLLISLFLSKWALRPVEKAWRQQQQFVADASHELKTPLTVILANVGILLSHREESVEKQLKWVVYIETEAHRMKKLVEDLLFLAKSDASKETAPQMELNLSDVAWSCLLPFESVAFEQGITLCSEIEPELYVLANDHQIRQVLMILLDNACKYAENKSRVLFMLERAADKVKLRVHNMGRPIPPEQLPHLFERFFRLDASRSRPQGGYGLGLAIAKSIAEFHHGKITVTSNEKDGTQFTLVLPLKNAAALPR